MLTLLILITVIFLYFCNQSESFVSKKDKAQTIFDWFDKQRTPTYTQYKKDFPNGTNVVEYEDALRLYQSGRGKNDFMSLL